MIIRFLGRNIEIANRVSVNHFKKENILIGVSYRKQDLKELHNIIDLLLYCIMPYKWLEKRYL